MKKEFFDPVILMCRFDTDDDIVTTSSVSRSAEEIIEDELNLKESELVTIIRVNWQ